MGDLNQRGSDFSAPYMPQSMAGTGVGMVPYELIAMSMPPQVPQIRMMAAHQMQMGNASGEASIGGQASSYEHQRLSNDDASPSNTGDFAHPGPGPLRRRRYSTAKVQPTRIKKVMQSDEEIGRMVASVPVAIGRAMEHFAEKFLQAAAEATHCSNSKTLTPQHMKQAMLSSPHFHFLEPVFKDVVLQPALMDAAMAKLQYNMHVEQEQLGMAEARARMAAELAMPGMMAPGNYVAGHQWMNYPQQAGVMYNGDGTMTQFAHPNSNVDYEDIKNITLIGEANGHLTMDYDAAGTSSGSTPTNNRRANGKKTSDVPAASTNGEVSAEKPKRGRPRKKKPENTIDEALFLDASSGVAQEDRDREMMPPPALPPPSQADRNPQNGCI